MDWEWAFDLLLRPSTDETAAGQLHLARSIPRNKIGGDAGKAMFDKAHGLDRVSFGPLADQLFVRAGQSDEKARARRHRSLDLAADLASSEPASLNTLRCLVSVLAEGGTSDRHSGACLSQIGRDQPDMIPTATWAD